MLWWYCEKPLRPLHICKDIICVHAAKKPLRRLLFPRFNWHANSAIRTCVKAPAQTRENCWDLEGFASFTSRDLILSKPFALHLLAGGVTVLVLLLCRLLCVLRQRAQSPPPHCSVESNNLSSPNFRSKWVRDREICSRARKSEQNRASARFLLHPFARTIVRICTFAHLLEFVWEPLLIANW